MAGGSVGEKGEWGENNQSVIYIRKLSKNDA